MARQREKDAVYERQLQERDKEIQRLKHRMKELVRKLTGKNGEVSAVCGGGYGRGWLLISTFSLCIHVILCDRTINMLSIASMCVYIERKRRI